jgi:hypothetical protein
MENATIKEKTLGVFVLKNLSEPRKLVESDLKPADILLFSPCKDFESQMIAKLTDSKVSHSAMIYLHTNKLTEEAPPYATQSLLKDRLTDEYKGEVYDRTIHVMRLTDQWLRDKQITSMDDVLKRASLYMEEEIPYSDYNFYILGLYIVIRKLLPKDHLKGLTRLLQLATVELVKFFDEKAYGDVHPFVCSQYVFNCYYTGDPVEFKYALQLDPSVLGNSLLKELMEIGDEAVSGLMNRNEAPKVIRERIEADLQKASPELLTPEGARAFLQDFIEAISQAKGVESTKLDLNESDNQDFVKAAHDFFEMFVKVFDLQGAKEGQSPLEKVYAFQEYFVTPNDLLENMNNLDYIGVLDNPKIK